MAQLKYLIIHCTATPEGREVSKADLEQWHLIERGWSKLGYSDIIHLDGSIENLHEYNEDNWVEAGEITNGAKGFNSVSRHVVYAGGGNGKDTRTKEQVEALTHYVTRFVSLHPEAKVLGHNQVNPHKSCPSFHVPTFLKDIGVEEKNIYRD